MSQTDECSYWMSQWEDQRPHWSPYLGFKKVLFDHEKKGVACCQGASQSTNTSKLREYMLTLSKVAKQVFLIFFKM